MSTTTALGVAQTTDSSGNVIGTDPLTLRKIIQSRYENTGIVYGLTVSGRSDLKYNIAAGVAICSKGSSDGYTEAYWAGGTTDAVSAGDASNPRIDLIYISSNDAQQGDTNNLVIAGVVQGTPAASPVAPSVPTGATAIAYMRIASGATSTANATRINNYTYAIPYGVGTGLIGVGSNTTSVDQRWDTTWYSQATATIHLSTDRYVNIVFDFRGHSKDGSISSMYFKVTIDGVDYSDGSDEKPFFDVYAREYISWSFGLSKGDHTVIVYAKANTNKTQIAWSGQRTLKVFDEGIEK